jgi:hypothetical protein
MCRRPLDRPSKLVSILNSAYPNGKTAQARLEAHIQKLLACIRKPRQKAGIAPDADSAVQNVK